MNEEDLRDRIERARQFARNDLGKIDSGLSGVQTHLGLLFSSMKSALHWAVEAWLGLQGDELSSSWQDQEARFLRIAPPGLQERYLGVSGGVRQLAAGLFDILGADRVDEVLIAAPALDVWRQQARLWLSDAGDLVAVLTEPESPHESPGARRVACGALYGNLQTFTPCLMLARGGSTHRPLGKDGPPPGLFDFGAPHATYSGLLVYSGVILPLACCRDTALQERLCRFSKRLLQPLGVDLQGDVAGLPVDARSRRRLLQTWLDAEGLDVLQLQDKEPLHRWTRFALTPPQGRPAPDPQGHRRIDPDPPGRGRSRPRARRPGPGAGTGAVGPGQPRLSPVRRGDRSAMAHRPAADAAVLTIRGRARRPPPLGIARIDDRGRFLRPR